MKLYKTTLVIFTEHNISDMEIFELRQHLNDGNIFISDVQCEKLKDARKDPCWSEDAEDFFNQF